MRVRIIFGLINKGANVPFHHQFLLSGFVEGLLKKYKDEFEDEQNYNFSGIKGQIKVGKDGLYFYSSKVTLVFSSPNEAFIDFFLRKLFKQQQFEIGKLQLVPMSVEKEDMPECKNEMKYLCISPLVIIDPRDDEGDPKKFISPALDAFSDLLYENTMIRMEKAGYTAEELSTFYKFQVVPDKEYLGKVKEGEKKFARVFPVYDEGRKLEVRGYTFPFTLYADPKVQDFILHSGLGYITNKGFGMLDIANLDPNMRTSPYQVKPD